MAKLTREQMDRIIDEHFQYEMTDDVEGVLSTLVQDVTHDVVGSPMGVLQGRKQAQGFYEQLYSDLKGEKVTNVRRFYGDDFMVDETIWEGIAVGTPLGIPGNNKPLSFRMLHVFEFAEDGNIKLENVWMDYGAIVQQLTS